MPLLPKTSQKLLLLQHNKGCRVLLMKVAGSVGLNLSFVTLLAASCIGIVGTHPLMLLHDEALGVRLMPETACQQACALPAECLITLPALRPEC